jgi:S1-C subfamily serine protease
VVQNAEPGGPAANAGIRDGDVIEAVDGRAVSAMGEVQSIVDSREPGQTLVLRVKRATSTRTVRVQLGRRPAQAP